MTRITRIVSFLPSATELIYEFGKEEMLFGVTHECKFPNEAQKKMKVITSVIDSEKLTSNEINNKTCQLLNDGKEIFKLNEKNLQLAEPDLIISQETCEVCAVHTNQVKKALAILEKKPDVYSMDPHNLNEILSAVTKLGEILGEQKKANEIRINLENRILRIKKIQHLEKPKVVALEWLDPFFTAGHWIPEMIEMVGGVNLISKRGENSKKINFNEIQNSDPDIILLMPCGFSSERTLKEYREILNGNKKWNLLRAVKNKKIFALDANSYFSKPSIRTITGLEILSEIIGPKTSKHLVVPENSYHNIFESINN